MHNGIYTAYSGMKAQMDALENLANNLANVNTTGFKEATTFYTFLNQVMTEGPGTETLNGTLNRSVCAQGALNLAEGSLSSTDRELDVAIEGGGFFAVDTSRGTRYTRNGNFHLDTRAMLTTSEGDPVLSVAGTPIQLGPGMIHINENGDVSLDGEIKGRLKVVTFSDLSALQKEGNSLFAVDPKMEPKAVDGAKMRSGYLEQSNVNAVASMVRMVNILRHFESIQKSVNLEMNEMNAKAIDKLGR